MGRTVLSVIASILVVSAAIANDPNKIEVEVPDRYARRTWDNIRLDLSEIVERLYKRPTLPRPSIWRPLREDTVSNERRIHKLMDKALSHLKIGKLSEHRQEYAALTAKIKRNRELIGQHRDSRVGAPEDTGIVSGLWTQSRDQHAKRIEELKAEIQSCETRQKELVEEMRQEMACMGIHLDDQQVANLLLHVGGDTFFDLSVCFHNTKQLTDLVAGLIEENEDYLENAQRYYGMYVSLMSIHLYAYECSQQNIEHQYIPKIEAMIERTKEGRTRTRDLMKMNPRDRNMLLRLQRNLDVQDTAIEAGNRYCLQLRQQLSRLKNAETELKRHTDVALNTYETITLASGMLSIMKKSIDDLTLIQSMQLPEMVPLDTEQIRLQFERITEQLRLIK